MGDDAAVLLRISEDLSRDARSIDGQRSAAQRVCRANGWTSGPESEYADVASASEYGSARGVERPGFERLKKDIASGRYRALVVAEVSRSARDVGVLEGLRKLLVRQGMLWAIGDRVMDPAEPGDTTLILIEGVLAQAETQRMSKRLRRGVTEARAAGRAPTGRCPFGFTRPTRPIGAKVVQQHDPVTGPLLVWAIRVAVPQGVSLSDIGRAWQAAGATSGHWARSSVRRAILNPAVVGMTVHYGDLIRGDWPPLVTMEEYVAAKEILMRPERRTNSSRESTTLLSSIARCECGSRIAARYSGYARPHYRCLVSAGSWPVERIDTLVELAMFEEVHAVAQRAAARGQAPVPDPRADAAADLAAAEARYAELNDQWHSLGLTLPEYAAAVRPLREAVVAARQRVASARPAPEVPRIDPAAYPAAWSMMTLDQRRAEVRRLLTVTLVPGGTAVVESAGL